MKTTAYLSSLILVATIRLSGAVLTVTNTADSGPGTLRQAIADAAAGDTINFAVNGSLEVLEEHLITKNLTISGPGATNLTLQASSFARVRIFTVTPGATVIIARLTMAGGQPHCSNGGAVHNGGTLTLQGCLITDNEASLGAGIFNHGTLFLESSTIAGNFTCYGGGFYGGGGIFNGASLTISNSTVSGNGTFDSGGGIFNASNSTARIVNSTIVGNRAGDYGPSYGGGIFNQAGGTLIVRSSILADNTGATADCDGELVSEDYNLIEKFNGTVISGATARNILGKDPRFGPLGFHGGSTPTHALLPDSPAIDRGSGSGLDQRGEPRRVNFHAIVDAEDGSDIGAFELQESAQAGADLVVNASDDTNDGVPGIAHCSLREAVNAANTQTNHNRIRFHPAVSGPITLRTQPLPLSHQLSIEGPAVRRLAVRGDSSDNFSRTPRVFVIAAGANVEITGLTIADGREFCGDGGGIYNSGTLRLNHCHLTRNAGSLGGAIFNAGMLAIQSSTLSGNYTCNGGGFYAGGAIYNAGTLFISTSTLSGNTASDGPGGAICNAAGATLALTNCTVARNGAAEEGGGIFNADGAVTLRNTLIAGNTASGGAPDVRGVFVSQDFNFIQDTNGCVLTGAVLHNVLNQDPLLGPLADLGGPTLMHALRQGSPALDAGHHSAQVRDQRNTARPLDDFGTLNVEDGDASDIGAYELDPVLRILSLELSGGDGRIEFNTILGRSYRVERKATLNPGPWTTVADNVAGSGGRESVLDAGAAVRTQHFYRVQQWP